MTHPSPTQGERKNNYTFTIETKSPAHITFRLHVNHGLAGTLVLAVEEFETFKKELKPQKIYE